MDHVKECTSLLIKNVLSATEKSLISAWENHNDNEDFSTEIAKAFEKVQNPFAGLETSYLQTEYMKKNLNYVGYRGGTILRYPYSLPSGGTELYILYSVKKKINWHHHIGIMIYQYLMKNLLLSLFMHCSIFCLIFGVIICIGHQ